MKDWKRGIQAKQENITITTDKLKKKKIQRVKNWKAPGPDRLQGYWIKTSYAVTLMLRDE